MVRLRGLPLPNITRTTTLELTPNRGAAIRQYVLTVLVLLFVMSLAASAAPGVVAALVILATLGWIAYKTAKLVAQLNLTLYELDIETAAGSHRGLVTDNPAVITDLAHRITDAINNPHAEFQMMVENFQVGDNFTMVGNRPPSNAAWAEPLVFVNYRSQDERPAADIETAVVHRLGRGAVFRDVHMPAGTAFPRELAHRAARCPVMVSVIGERWDDAHNLRLLHTADDWVHREIATALANRAVVVPVLIGARPRLAANDLPADIRALAHLQGPHLPRDYEPHAVHRLVENLVRDVPALAMAAHR